MNFTDLGLWKEEEKKIHDCITTALDDLINSFVVNSNDDEDTISGKLDKFLHMAKKKYKLKQFIIKRQVAVYAQPDDAKPNGYPDFGVFWNDSECDQHEYHIECKRVNPKNTSSGWNFCSQYIRNGVERYRCQIYGRNYCSGTMIGYIQLGNLDELLYLVNQEAGNQRIAKLDFDGKWNINSWTKFCNKLDHVEDFVLNHYWADFRQNVG